MKLSVNILTWNTLKILLETMLVLKDELSGMDAEIIVVDNGSIDGTREWMELKDKIPVKIKYIRNEKNLGISKGKNQGVDASQGDYIMLIDGDIIPVPNSIRLLVKHLDENQDCQALGFLPNKFSLNRNGDHERICTKLDPIIKHRGHCIYYGIYRREVFKSIRFDESYGVGYGWEDLDSYMQMEHQGITQWAAGINHLSGKYYHAMNSSINNKDCLGFEKYMESSNQRGKIFKSKWGAKDAVIVAA